MTRVRQRRCLDSHWDRKKFIFLALKELASLLRPVGEREREREREREGEREREKERPIVLICHTNEGWTREAPLVRGAVEHRGEPIAIHNSCFLGNWTTSVEVVQLNSRFLELGITVHYSCFWENRTTVVDVVKFPIPDSWNRDSRFTIPVFWENRTTVVDVVKFPIPDSWNQDSRFTISVFGGIGPPLIGHASYGMHMKRSARGRSSSGECPWLPEHEIGGSTTLKFCLRRPSVCIVVRVTRPINYTSRSHAKMLSESRG